MRIKINSLNEMLLKQWHYKEKQIDDVVKKILNMDPELQNAFEDFIENGEFPIEPVYFGLEPKTISENYPFKPPAVFLCMDWIRREPETALNALVEEYHKPLPKTFDPEKLRDFIEEKKMEIST